MSVFDIDYQLFTRYFWLVEFVGNSHPRYNEASVSMIGASFFYYAKYI